MEGQSGFADLYDTDDFRLYCFKILHCSKVGADIGRTVFLPAHTLTAASSKSFNQLFLSAEGATQLAAVCVCTLGREG
jgi:hypothetical protein